jgi:hypothetical protein
MLHMVVMTHGADTCAAALKGPGEMADMAIEQIGAVSKKHNVAVQGWWVDPPGHVFFMLAEAPSAHALTELMIELKLFHWNTVQIHPIMTVTEAKRLLPV